MNAVFSPKNNTPQAYIDGVKDFYGRNFIVTPDVLIPRPETEQIIDAVLNLAGIAYLPGVKPTPRILPPHPIICDIGTGSGCIAITIKKEFPEAEVYATDISEKSLKIAQKNAKIHGASLHTTISHLAEKINGKDIPHPYIIVANLPYVDPEWDWLDKTALSCEPKTALYADDHGLALIKELIDQVAILHTPYLILEADPCQHDDIIHFATKKGLEHVETRGFILTFCTPQE